jgi:hypothetical protein
MNKKQPFELILLIIFLLSGLCAPFKIIPYSWLIMALSGLLLGSLYFPLGFWLFAWTGMSVAGRILAGLVFGINIVACMYSWLHWPYWKLFGIISYIALGIMLIICSINFKSAAYKPLLYRSVLFLVILSAILGYRYFAS